MQLSDECQRYIEASLRLLYPAACGHCEARLELEEKALCGICQKRLDTSRFSYEDSSLDLKLNFLDQAWALYPYESPFKEILSSIKFSQKRWLLQAFESAVEDFSALIRAENQFDLIIPIPLDPERLMTRHFNQSGILAKMLAKALEAKSKSLIRKVYSTPAQHDLSQKERAINLYGSFRLSPWSNVRGKKILLVDDITTTGATAEEAARVLKQQGALEVSLWALAHTSLKPVSAQNPAGSRIHSHSAL